MSNPLEYMRKVPWAIVWRGAKSVLSSEVAPRARLGLAGLFGLLLAINGLNVFSSFVGRDFMTAVERRDASAFVELAVLSIVVFGALAVAAVTFRLIEERLGILWREWLTGQLVRVYLNHPTYYRLNDHLLANGEVANPDQRIADDVRTFTATTLSFLLMISNGTLTVLAFSGVMWSISPMLFVVAVLYAIAGSYIAILLGHGLVGLNITQLDREATFRADLIHVRENAESIAMARYESQIKTRVLRDLAALANNVRSMILVNRNLGLFTNWYNYLLQIIPALIVAPLFMASKADFGVIAQSAVAFAQLTGAFSIIVNQFQSISSYAAVIARLDTLAQAIESAQAGQAPLVRQCNMPDNPDCPICKPEQAIEPNIEFCPMPGEEMIGFDQLSLLGALDQAVLVENLSVEVKRGQHLQVLGPNSKAQLALFKATAGIWTFGTGAIHRPGAEDILFVPERPYLPPGTLRELLTGNGHVLEVSDAEIRGTFKRLHAEFLVDRAQGLKTEQNWGSLFSLTEQQLLACVRLLLIAPSFAVFQHPCTTLDRKVLALLLSELAVSQVTWVIFEHSKIDTVAPHRVLNLNEDATWTVI